MIARRCVCRNNMIMLHKRCWKAERTVSVVSSAFSTHLSTFCGPNTVLARLKCFENALDSVDTVRSAFQHRLWSDAVVETGHLRRCVPVVLKGVRAGRVKGRACRSSCAGALVDVS
jgi:hypothetical protein